jgi:hypothetical protein
MNKKELQEKIKKFVNKRVKEDNVSTNAGGYSTKYAYEKPPKDQFQPAVFAKGAKDLSAYKNAGYREVKPSEMIDAKYLWRENINAEDTITKIIDIDPNLLDDIPSIEVDLINDPSNPDAFFKMSAMYHSKDNGKMKVFQKNPGLQKAVIALLQKEFQKTFRKVIHGVLGKPFGLNENINPKDTIKTDVPLFIRLLEYAREDAKTDMDLHNVAEKTIALSGEDRTLTMSDYDNIVGSKTLNETRYNQFKKQTEVVKPSTQMYIAMKEIKKRLQEVNKIANYTNKLKTELSENNDIHYNKRTDVVIEQLMEEIKTLYKNLKQIQENGRQS